MTVRRMRFRPHHNLTRRRGDVLVGGFDETAAPKMAGWSSRDRSGRKERRKMANARMRIVRRIVAVIAVVLGIALSGFAETVTNVRGSQRPNSNLVDIYYDLNITDGWSYTVEVAIEGRTNEVTATTFSGDVGKGIAPGKNHHIVWEAGADWRDKKGDVKVVVTATIEAKKGKLKKVQLWKGGPYWADRNIGAEKPEDAGYYFWWGDTVGYKPIGGTFNNGTTYVNVSWKGSDGSTLSGGFTDGNCKTCGKSKARLQSEGWIIADGVLTLAHDAAHVLCGGDWRMPRVAEIEALIDNCDWTRTTRNGVDGYVVRGRNNYVSNSIFLPASGFGMGTSLILFGSWSIYWLSVPDSGSDSAYKFGFDPSGCGMTSDRRDLGQPIRPVQGFSN